LTKYDELIRSTLETVLNISLSTSAWTQATLPVSVGGLGIRKATDIALPCYLSSIVGSSTLQHTILPWHLHDLSTANSILYTDALALWQCLSTTDAPEITTHNICKQKTWDTPLVLVIAHKLKTTASTQADIARLLAVSSPHAGDFLNVIPCSSLGTRLDDSSLRIAIALRLGAKICEPHQCGCGEEVDASGTHGLSCRSSAGRMSRHAAVNDLIKRSLASAEVPSRLEPSSLCRNDGKRPDGITIIPWKEGRCMVWDFTCPDTLAKSHLNLAVSAPGSVASDAEARKRLKYSSLAATYSFIPIAIETFGALGESASYFFKEVGKRVTKISHEPRATQYIMQRLSVAIQRGNAASIIGTFESSDSLDDLFCL
jgi:hypothetical protein